MCGTNGRARVFFRGRSSSGSASRKLAGNETWRASTPSACASRLGAFATTAKQDNTREQRESSMSEKKRKQGKAVEQNAQTYQHLLRTWRWLSQRHRCCCWSCRCRGCYRRCPGGCRRSPAILARRRLPWGRLVERPETNQKEHSNTISTKHKTTKRGNVVIPLACSLEGRGARQRLPWFVWLIFCLTWFCSVFCAVQGTRMF